LARYYQENTYLENADIAYDYLIPYLYDKQYHGVFWKSSFSGQVINDTKHIYAQGFAIYGLCEYYLACGRSEALDIALEIFHTIEEKSFCPVKNAYHEQFTRDWVPTENKLLAINSVLPAYTTNTMIHLIEAYTSLYLAAKLPEIRHCIIRLLHLFFDKVYNTSGKGCYTEFDIAWKPIQTVVSFGHDIETSWLIDRAMDTIQYHPVRLTKMTSTLCENTFLHGFTEGMIHSGVNNDNSGDTLVWWIQAEAVIGFLNYFQKTGNTAYLDAARKTLDVIMTKIVDHRMGGEWFWSVDRTGKPVEDFGISENWKANYHNVRMCLEILKRGDML
jgi:mannobiose 2-epimerase